MSCLLNKISYHIVENIIVLIDSDDFLAQMQKIVHRFNDLKIIDRINIKRTKVILNTTQPQIDDGKKVVMSYFIKNGSTNDRPSEIRKSDTCYVWTKKTKNKLVYYRDDDLPVMICNTKCLRAWGNVLDNCHRNYDLPSKYYYTNDFVYIMSWLVHGFFYRDHYLPMSVCSDGYRYWCNDGHKATRKVYILNEYV